MDKVYVIYLDGTILNNETIMAYNKRIAYTTHKGAMIRYHSIIRCYNIAPERLTIKTFVELQ